jgi:hypothetical protein
LPGLFYLNRSQLLDFLQNQKIFGERLAEAAGLAERTNVFPQVKRGE